MSDKLDILIARFLEGRADEKEVRQLEERLRDDPKARAELYLASELNQGIRKELRAGEYKRILSKKTKPPRARPLARRSWSWVPTAAAVFLVALGAYWLLTQPLDPVATIAESGDAVVIERGDEKSAAAAGQQLRPGDRLHAQKGDVTFLFDDKTRVKLTAGGKLVVKGERFGPAGKRLFVANGNVNVTAARQPTDEPMVILTPHAITTLLGTELSLGVDAGRTRLVVNEGSVRMKSAHDGTTVDVTEGQQAEVPKGSSAWTAELGTGLRGQYFEGGNFEARKLDRVDRSIDFDWGEGSVTPELPTEHFSVRWEGQLMPRENGTHTFHAGADDGIRLWVDGRLTIDQWHAQAFTEHSGRVDLTAGRKVAIKLEFNEITGFARVRLSWSTDRLKQETIPQFCLFPAPAKTPDSTDAPTKPGNP